MAGKKNKFVEAAHATRKGKATARTTGPPPKWPLQPDQIIMLLPPFPPPAIEETTPTKLESSSKGTIVAVPIQAD